MDSPPIDYSYDDADTMPSKADYEDLNAKQLITNREEVYLITELVDESASKLKVIAFPIQSNTDLKEVDNEIANGKKREYVSYY